MASGMANARNRESNYRCIIAAQVVGAARRGAAGFEVVGSMFWALAHGGMGGDVVGPRAKCGCARTMESKRVFVRNDQRLVKSRNTVVEFVFIESFVSLKSGS
ncbi:MAG: hypothetical protein LBU11_01095 [Zoogloeaceae bacterium]|jgi:hypothetical protein|nr:hypothetical protein [Zoogloeaceae bacterium]